MADESVSRKRELEEPCLSPVPSKRVCKRPIVADTSMIAKLANEINELTINKSTAARDLNRVSYKIRELLKRPDDRSFSFSTDDRRKVRRYLDRDQEDDEDAESASTSSRQAASDRLYNKILMVFLVDTLNIGIQMESPDNDWFIRMFILVNCLHNQPLDPMVECTPENVRREVHQILYKALDLLAISNETGMPIVTLSVTTYINLRAAQTKYMERLYLFRGNGLLLDILSWKSVSIEPYTTSRKKLGRCYITHQLFAMEDLMCVRAHMYNATELSFPVHVTLAPFLIVFQFFVNMGTMLTVTTTHLKENPGKWLDQLARIYHLSYSALEGFLTATSSLDLSATLQQLISE